MLEVDKLRRPGRPLAPKFLSRFIPLVCAALAFQACGKDHDPDSVKNPADPSQSGISAPTPSIKSAEVGTRAVTLDWDLSDSTRVGRIRKYRVYKRLISQTEVELTDSTAAPPLTLGGLVNGLDYRVSVSAVLDTGLEGKRSEEVSAVPAVFGMVIADGRERTASQQPAVTFQAPTGSTGLQISNDPDLSLVPVQPFATTRSWQLTPGDGLKTVYARFYDAQGNPSVRVSDTVTLDTRADILSVSFTPQNAQPGQTLHVVIVTGEAHGTARARLGDGGRELILRDDGAGGDHVADDGTYELDYVIEDDLELLDALVTATFNDEVGNDATRRIAAERLTVHRNPVAVTLAPIESPSPEELLLSWSQASDSDRFSAYRVFRAEQPGVDQAIDRRLVQEIGNRTETTLTDGDLDPSTTYYYRVYVVDPFGNSVSSNEQSARPKENDPPEAVILNGPSNVTEESVSLSWSQSFAADFQAYRLYRGEQSNLETDPKRRLLAEISSKSETTFDDRNQIEQNKTYFYQVQVVDRLGALGKSNIVSATTLDQLPEAVTLSVPTSVGETTILLSWSKNTELDFARYELRRADQAGVGPSSSLITTVTQAENTSYLNTGLIENQDYFYRVFVIDRGGNTVGSNEIRQTTDNADPAAVTITNLTEATGAATPTVSLSWTASDAHDFDEYRIYRDTAPSVSETSTLVRTIDVKTLLSFSDNNLQDNTRYYYRVFVRDDAGGSTGSSESSIVTANRAPKAVSLSVGSTTTNSITLNWTRSPDDDFSEYRLLQGTTSSNITTLVASYTQVDQTTATVFVNTDDETVYFFKVEVYDQSITNAGSRLKTDSNIVSASAAN